MNINDILLVSTMAFFIFTMFYVVKTVSDNQKTT